METQELRLKKAHIRLMRHPETALYGSVIMMGESSIQDTNCPTAYTDGKNKRYGRTFLEGLNTIQEVAGLVLHENLHVLLQHIPRHKDLMKQNAQLTNVAMDFVVNDIIMSIEDKELCSLPKGGLHDLKYRGWSVRQVYDDLKKESDDGSGEGEKLKPLDEHGTDLVDGMTEEQVKELSKEVSEALQHGALMSNKLGVAIPRAIKDMMTPEVDWKEVMSDFVQTHTRGKDEYTWSKFDRKRLADGYYLPSTISESVGEIVVSVDTSGSIGTKELAEFATELSELCNLCTPDRVRVLWWDTQIHGEQIFEGNYDSIANMLKPEGGGGTRVGCVPEYINKNGINADCMIVFTDGYVESDINWSIDIPTLWIVKGNKDFKPPSGQMVLLNN